MEIGSGSHRSSRRSGPARRAVCEVVGRQSRKPGDQRDGEIVRLASRRWIAAPGVPAIALASIRERTNCVLLLRVPVIGSL